MAYKIIWSPKAVATFETVIEYLHEKWSDKEVRSFINLSEKAIHILSQNPFLFRSSEKKSIHEVLITKHNLLLYQISSKSRTVELLTFFDTRQDPKKKKGIY